VLRESIYALLVRSPTKSWTVRDLCGELGDGTRAFNDRVREVLYVLLADEALMTVAGHRSLTVALTEAGETALRSLVAGWNGRPHNNTPARPLTPGASARGANSQRRGMR
jgi:hypothetical protein